MDNVIHMKWFTPLELVLAYKPMLYSLGPIVIVVVASLKEQLLCDNLLYYESKTVSQ